MEKIKTVRVSTGKGCAACSGIVDELFEKKFGKFNGIFGPGGHTPSRVTSIGFSCNKCFLAYIAPDHKSALQDEEQREKICFELELSKATLIRSITLEDIPDTLVYRKKKTGSIGHSLSPYYKKARSVPKELRELKAGDVLYHLPNDSSNYELGSNSYGLFIFTPEKTSKIFKLQYHCFK